MGRGFAVGLEEEGLPKPTPGVGSIADEMSPSLAFEASELNTLQWQSSTWKTIGRFKETVTLIGPCLGFHVTLGEGTPLGDS